jgi:hypothetical protein
MENTPMNKKPNAAIEGRTAILPYVVADCVLGELERYFGGTPFAARDAIAEKLYEKAQACYQSKGSQFQKKVDSKAGRDYLYTFMRHWLSGEIKDRYGDRAFEALPYRYCAGAPVNPELRATTNENQAQHETLSKEAKKLVARLKRISCGQ